MGDIYVILLENDVLDGKTYRSFDEAKQALIDTAMTKEWRLENGRDENPIVGFKNKFGIVDNDETNEVEFPKEGGNGLTELYAKGEGIGVEPVNIRKLTLNANGSPPPADVEAAEAEEDKKERKKRGPMSDAAKAAMKAKREATIAAKKASSAGRRRTAKIIRMKKGEYLREHHHLFRVLRNPTRRALNAELRKQQKELKERGLRG
jgi:hypothetical protein